MAILPSAVIDGGSGLRSIAIRSPHAIAAALAVPAGAPSLIKDISSLPKRFLNSTAHASNMKRRIKPQVPSAPMLNVIRLSALFFTVKASKASASVHNNIPCGWSGAGDVIFKIRSFWDMDSPILCQPEEAEEARKYARRKLSHALQ